MIITNFVDIHTTEAPPAILIAGGIGDADADSRKPSDGVTSSSEVFPSICSTPSLPWPRRDTTLFTTVEPRSEVAICGGSMIQVKEPVKYYLAEFSCWGR